MHTKRIHSIEIRRFYQRLENVERRRKEAEQLKSNKRGLLARIVGNYGKSK